MVNSSLQEVKLLAAHTHAYARTHTHTHTNTRKSVFIMKPMKHSETLHVNIHTTFICIQYVYSLFAFIYYFDIFCHKIFITKAAGSSSQYMLFRTN